MLGVGPSAPLDPNSPQSLLNYRFDLIDSKAIFRLARILDYGAKKYGPNNWRSIPQDDHINHALAHLFAYLDNNLSEEDNDDHLGHAFCRIMFAIGMEDNFSITGCEHAWESHYNGGTIAWMNCKKCNEILDVGTCEHNFDGVIKGRCTNCEFPKND